MKKQISETEMAYFAGLFDGEGCVLLGKSQAGYGIQAHINITYIPNLERLRNIFGGSITLHKKRAANHKQLYEWFISGRNVHDFLQTILPYLSEKKPQAELSIQYCEELGMGAIGGRRRSIYDKSRQEWYYKELKRLKTIEYYPGSTSDTAYRNNPEQLRLVE